VSGRLAGYRARWRAENEDAREWKGAYRPYDIVKEVVICLTAVIGICVLLSVLFSSPDDPPSTIAQWSRQLPVDFVTTATAELDGTSGVATYGPPYNHNGDGQFEWFIHLQKWLGVSHPINAAQDFVLAPLHSIPGKPGLTAAINEYQSASAEQQMAWTTAYANALGKAKTTTADAVVLPAGRYGPVPMMMGSLLSLAQAGGLDGALLTSRQFYQTDFTNPLLFLADGSLLADRAQADHLLGEQWGMMNETGSWPGQVWLWLYTLWYQVKPFSTSDNADILVMTVMGVLSLLFLLIPFLPIVRDIPRWVPLYRAIWREHYRDARRPPAAAAPPRPPPVPT
jgi:hypothetical protein